MPKYRGGNDMTDKGLKKHGKEIDSTRIDGGN